MSKKTPALQPWQVEDAKRLRDLYEKKEEKIPQDKFGPKYGIGSQGMVWQYLTAYRALNITAAEKFASALNVQIEQFSPTLAEEIKKAASKVTVKESRFSPETLRFAEKFERLGPEGREKFEKIYKLVQDEEGNGGDGDDPDLIPKQNPPNPRPHPMRRKEDRNPPGAGKRNDNGG